MALITLVTLLLVSAASACLHQTRDLNQHDVRGNNERRSLMTAATSPKNKTGIRDVHIFNGRTFRLGSVAIVGDKISFDLDDVDHWIEGNNRFLIPGLIDSHCHPEALEDLHRLSSYGVTTAISMGCLDYELCNSLRNQTGLTSYITASNGIITPNSTHAIVSGADPKTLIQSPNQASEYVAWAFGNHSDFLKIIAEASGPNQTIQNALVAETHKRGRQAMTHAPDITSYAQSIESKTDGIQHTPGDAYVTQRMLERMKNQGQFIVPTTVLVKAFLASPVLALTTYNNESWPVVIENVKRMHKASLPLLVGTDAISLHDPYAKYVKHPLGNTLHTELNVFVNEVGFAPADALRAATSLPAKIYGLGDRGKILDGFRADLVLLESNPLKNISRTTRIARVWNGGVVYKGVAVSN